MLIEASIRKQLWTTCMGLALVACGDRNPNDDGDEGGGHTSISTVSASETGSGGSQSDSMDDGRDTDSNDGSGTESSSGDSTTGVSTTHSETTVDDGVNDDSTGTGTQMTGADDGPVPCEVANATLTPVPPNVMLVLDKSRSMISNKWNHDDDPNTPEVTRWNSLYQVVDFVVTTFNNQIHFGANLFPWKDAPENIQTFEQACEVAAQPEVPVGPMNAAAILTEIPGPNDDNEIWGATPATAGFVVARDHITSLPPENPRAIVFIADGAANCKEGETGTNLLHAYDSNLPIVVGNAWTNQGIPTYVVGIDIQTSVTSGGGDPQGIVPWEVMNDVAEAGGKPRPGPEKFYQTTNEIELQAALQEIIDDTLSCIVTLNPVPGFPDLLEIHVGNMLVPKVNDCETEDGWVYTDQNHEAVELCGSWCGQLKSSGSMKAEYFCNPG